jgi:hypothetical protein
VILVALSFRCFAIWVLALPLLFSVVTNLVTGFVLVRRSTCMPRYDRPKAFARAGNRPVILH